MGINIDIVIPHYGHVVKLKKLLKSIESILLPQSLNKIIVVENGPKSGAEELCQSCRNLSVLYCYALNPGITEARNKGIAKSNADFIIFFDNDIDLFSNTLVAYEKSFLTKGQNYFYGGPVIPRYEVEPQDWILKFVPPSVSGLSLEPKDKEVTQSIFLGGNHAISRKCISSSIEHFGQVFEGESATGSGGGLGEEHRLQQRLLDIGFRGYYVASASVYHPVPKECLTHGWICQRRYRRGLTDAKRVGQSNSGILMCNTPIWVFKRYFIEKALEMFFRPWSPAKALSHGVNRAWTKGIIDHLWKYNSTKKPNY